MPIRVRFFGSLKDYSKKREIIINLQTKTMNILSLMQYLSEKLGKNFNNALINPETGQIRYYIKIMVNGTDIAVLDGLKTIIKEDDIIQVFPPIAGG